MELRTTAYPVLKRSTRSSFASSALRYTLTSLTTRSGSPAIPRERSRNPSFKRPMRGMNPDSASKSASGSLFTRATSTLHCEDKC